MNTILPAGVIFVDDIVSVAAFYQAVAGLQEIHVGDGHIVLEGAGYQLTIHALPDQGAAHRYPTRADTHIKLCFPVIDLAQARAAAALHGGEIWQPDQDWIARGFRACDGRDPEGNVFQVRQVDGLDTA
jgi:predicted enzyme related to lactoylglutathione lyase